MGLYGMNDSRIVNNTVVPRDLATASEIRLTHQKDGTPSSGDIIRNNLARAFNTGAAVNTQHSNNITVGTDYARYFADHPGGDLHLKPGSPAINGGTDRNAPTVDADRRQRSAPFDVGAYSSDPSPSPLARCSRRFDGTSSGCREVALRDGRPFELDHQGGNGQPCHAEHRGGRRHPGGAQPPHQPAVVLEQQIDVGGVDVEPDETRERHAAPPSTASRLSRLSANCAAMSPSCWGLPSSLIAVCPEM